MAQSVKIGISLSLAIKALFNHFRVLDFAILLESQKLLKRSW